MLTLAEKKFKKLVLQLFQKHKSVLWLNVKNKNDTSLDVEIRIPGFTAGFRAIIVRTSTSHTEEEPDPRGFGDTSSVVDANMRGWYPGKTSTWTRNRCNFTLQAWNLPSETMPDFTANYSYDYTNSSNDWSEGYELEKIYELLIKLQKERQSAFRAGKETEYADNLTDAFKDLL